MNKAIIIFTRVPLPGLTKTRLMPIWNGQQCAALHRCFLQDIYAECKKVRADIYVCYTPEGKQELLFPIFGSEVSYRLQVGADLGERMTDAIGSVLAHGYDACVLIGTDVPEISAGDIEQAFQQLKAKDVVFGPTRDGGYYLVAMRKLHDAVFAGKTYGHGSVLVNAVHGLQKQGLETGYVEQRQDIDYPADLRVFYQRVRQNQKLKQSAAGRYVIGRAKISIIIPIYNEEKRIRRMMAQLQSLAKQCEVIFVDGGSSDRTLALLGTGYTVIHSAKGRAVQMNAGAKASSGDILFFLHCDSILPRKPLEQIREVMKDHTAGGFGIAFYSHNFFMFTNRIISNHRMKYRRIIFGDQGMFIDRDLFFHLGMFPELPLMEDYQFSLNLRNHKIKIGMTRRRIYTSDRRYPRGTFAKLRLMWKMNRLRSMYRAGVPVQVIAKQYKDIR